MKKRANDMAACGSFLPLLNYRGKVDTQSPYTRGKVATLHTVDMTRAQWAALPADDRGTRIAADGTHRVRVAMGPVAGKLGLQTVCVFVTDAIAHDRPGDVPTRAQADPAARIAPSARAGVAARNTAAAKPAFLRAVPVAPSGAVAGSAPTNPDVTPAPRRLALVRGSRAT